jgi:hypothetical protein
MARAVTAPASARFQAVDWGQVTRGREGSRTLRLEIPAPSSRGLQQNAPIHFLR